MIESVVKLWLKNSNFVDRFKEYYDSHHDFDGKEQHDVKYIRDELDYIGRPCSSTDDPDTYFVDNGMKYVNIRSRNMFRTGYYITANSNGYKMILYIEYGDEKYKKPLNQVLNEFLGEAYFTENIFSSNWRESDEIKSLVVGSMGDIQEFSGLFLNRSLYSFFTETNFINEYLKLNHGINNGITGGKSSFKAKKDDILAIASRLGYEGKYYSKERFCNVEKKIGSVVLGYNISFSHNICIFIFYGKKNDELLFFAPSVESYVKMLVKEKVTGMIFHSIDELEKIFEFMLGYLDVLASYFGNN